MCRSWLIFITALATLVISAIVYAKSRKGSNEHYRDSVFSHLNAYNNVYAPPRPQFYQDCVGYNMWVRDANALGKLIANDCKKKFPGDVRCPMDNPWTETPCGL